jgi:hypothetical protein
VRASSSSGRNAPSPTFTLSTSGNETLESFYAHDAGCDYRHRAGRVAEVLKPPVQRGDIGGLPSHRSPYLLDHGHEPIQQQVGAKTRYGLELVERASGVTESTASHHWNAQSQFRREYERYLVAHAAHGVLVHLALWQVREVQRTARFLHHADERVQLLRA